MFDYQVLRAAYCLKMGFTEQGEPVNSDQMSLAELDELESKMGIK